MTANELLAEIARAFDHEPYPGDDRLVTNNTPGYDLEALQIRDTFKRHTWQTMPDELLRYEVAALSFLSPAGLRYYLPAFLQFAVRGYVASDSIPESLVFHLTPPPEIAEVLADGYRGDARAQQDIVPHMAAAAAQPGPAPVPESEAHRRVHYFLARYGCFDGAQARAIRHFLEHLRDHYAPDFFDDEPAVAIRRYWFRFA